MLRATINDVKAAVTEFQAVQHKLASFGAEDTEPDTVFQRLVRNVWFGQEYHIPKTGSEWQLYTGTKDCEEAAERLYYAAKIAVSLISKVPVGKRKEVGEYLSDICWRFPWKPAGKGK